MGTYAVIVQIILAFLVLGSNAADEVNRTLNGEACRRYLLHVDAHGGGFWDPKSTDHYHQCLWVLRHAGATVMERQVAVGGQHYPTIVLTNHREPSMQYRKDKKPPGSHQRYAHIPMQAFQDTQASYARKELEVPYHFVLPYFDVNIGNIIKQQGSMNHFQSYQMQMIARPGDTVIDVGGNLGCYTLALAAAVGPSGRVFSFEPFRWIHQLLTANVAVNGLQNVWPLQVALGRAPELVSLFPPQLRFFSSPGGIKVEHQDSQVRDRPLMEGFQLYDLNAGEGSELVRVVRLDDLLLGDGGRWWGLPTPVSDVRLIKIDVEGMETAVIEGAVEVIRIFKPIIWSENNAYFESNGKDIGFLQVLTDLGYFCSKTEPAPTDVICMDQSGAGHHL